jgi:NADH:ubiquinone reductase (H+-translocating)
LPAAGNRLRIAADWTLNLVSRPIAAQLGLVDPAAGRLGGAETPARRRRHRAVVSPPGDPGSTAAG